MLFFSFLTSPHPPSDHHFNPCFLYSFFLLHSSSAPPFLHHRSLLLFNLFSFFPSSCLHFSFSTFLHIHLLPSSIICPSLQRNHNSGLDFSLINEDLFLTLADMFLFGGFWRNCFDLSACFLLVESECEMNTKSEAQTDRMCMTRCLSARPPPHRDPCSSCRLWSDVSHAGSSVRLQMEKWQDFELNGHVCEK